MDRRKFLAGLAAVPILGLLVKPLLNRDVAKVPLPKAIKVSPDEFYLFKNDMPPRVATVLAHDHKSLWLNIRLPNDRREDWILGRVDPDGVTHFARVGRMHAVGFNMDAFAYDCDMISAEGDWFQRGDNLIVLCHAEDYC